MSKNKLVISPAAQEDLKSIYQYAKANWEVTRATDYIHYLKAQFQSQTIEVVGVLQGRQSADLHIRR